MPKASAMWSILQGGPSLALGWPTVKCFLLASGGPGFRYSTARANNHAMITAPDDNSRDKTRAIITHAIRLTRWGTSARINYKDASTDFCLFYSEATP